MFVKNRIDFLRRAKVDLKICKKTIRDWEDEIEIEIAAYHLQQALEKAMKHLIIIIGSDYPRTHEIKHLWSQLDALGYTPPEWIWEHRRLLTDFSDKTRYGERLISTQREVMEFIPLLEEYIWQIDQNFTDDPEDDIYRPSSHL